MGRVSVSLRFWFYVCQHFVRFAFKLLFLTFFFVCLHKYISTFVSTLYKRAIAVQHECDYISFVHLLITFLLLVFVLFLQTESLKISSDHDMHDWFYDRDVKDPAVILHDKLISDALLNGTGPIKTEHSYSLNSDGDSLPDSPKSLQAKIDGRYCYNCVIDILSKNTGSKCYRLISANRYVNVFLSLRCLKLRKTNTVASWWLHCKFRPCT